MREILFRAWDKVSKKYREFDGMHDTMTINEDGKVEYYNLQNGSGGDEYILEQFTGLHDATKWEDLTDAERYEWIKSGHTKEDWKGKRIFEGDIVHIDNYDEGWDSVVEFNGGAFAVDVEGRDYDYTAIGWTEYQSIIIGNIHDNKMEDLT